MTTYTLTEENYLKAIYKLSRQEDVKITPTAIAEEIVVNAASVIDMLKKLKEKKLISYDKKAGASLNTEGKKLAVNIVRKHRLWEVFLYDKLGFDWDEIHEMAEQLEHIQNTELADRLDNYLGNPKYDPHGDAIPTATGVLPKEVRTILSKKKPGDQCVIAAIKDTSVEFLQYLQHLGIKIGSKLQIKDIVAFDNSFIIKLNGKEITVSEKFANSIYVQ